MLIAALLSLIMWNNIQLDERETLVEFVSKRQYYWSRKTGDEFIINYALDPLGKRITVIQKFTAGENTQTMSKPGVEKISTLTYFDDCKILNDQNWSCPANADEYIFMQNGQLIWVYWGEIREFQ